MKILIIIANPNPGSFSHALGAETAGALRGNGHEVVSHDLCAEGFDPVLPARELPPGAPLPPDVQRHCDEAVSAGGIVIIHPNWWGTPPAVLKGWVDRVLRQGVAYAFGTGDSGEGVPVGLLKARAAVVFNTSNTPPDREKQAFGDPLENLWKKCIFAFCGVPEFHRRNYGVMITSTLEQRKQWLADARKLVAEVFPR